MKLKKLRKYFNNKEHTMWVFYYWNGIVSDTRLLGILRRLIKNEIDILKYGREFE